MGRLRLGADPIGSKQDQQVVDVDHPVAVEITEAWLRAVYAITIGAKPLTEVVDTFLLRCIHDATTGHAAWTDLCGWRAIGTRGVGQPITAGIKAVLFPGLQAAFTETAGAGVGAVITTRVMTKPGASDERALVLPEQEAASCQAAGAGLWWRDAGGAVAADRGTKAYHGS